VAERQARTWVPADQARGLKAHGTSPATGIEAYTEITTSGHCARRITERIQTGHL
jgi:hypothetical protein